MDRLAQHFYMRTSRRGQKSLETGKNSPLPVRQSDEPTMSDYTPMSVVAGQQTENLLMIFYSR